MIRFALLLALAPLLAAQTTVTRTIQASGTASLSVQPDQAKFTVGVVTQATTATAAASENATVADAVTKKLTSVLTGRGSVQTTGYSITPRYSTTTGKTSELVGYTVTNTMQVKVNDLTIIGSVIDAAYQSGANSVGSLQFTLQNSEPTKQQALAAAAKVARAHAESIATGLGGTLGRVITAAEGSSIVSSSSTRDTTAVTATSTPVTTGTVEVTATVTIEAELQ